jgi:hypothetical protein
MADCFTWQASLGEGVGEIKPGDRGKNGTYPDNHAPF